MVFQQVSQRIQPEVHSERMWNAQGCEPNAFPHFTKTFVVALWCYDRDVRKCVPCRWNALPQEVLQSSSAWCQNNGWWSCDLAVVQSLPNNVGHTFYTLLFKHYWRTYRRRWTLKHLPGLMAGEFFSGHQYQTRFKSCSSARTVARRLVSWAFKVARTKRSFKFLGR